ncbi:prepilin-type N-terminal cleavage/methylation domain-containing protein [Clostridiaceae bacterium HSG29]|nr:prepilin-type N-terminal cleavage/methylation domain-containing protein [Clostridiaceae bacterium HSG29]
MKFNNKGFTLIELIIVITIIAIIQFDFTDIAKEKVCDYNRKQIQRYYEVMLIGKSLESTEELFNEFLELNDIKCPSGGVFTYSNGEVNCSVHNKETDNEEVPFL